MNEALVEAVVERVAAWPASPEPWWAEPWPFGDGSQAQALLQPWLLGVGPQQWLAAHGGPAILLALVLRLSPQLLDRILGDLCRRPPVIDRFRCLAAGPASEAREALWERLCRELPGALAVLERLEKTPIVIGPDGEGFRQGYITGAWEEYWRAERAERVSPVGQTLAAIAREGLEQEGHHRWLKSYRQCVTAARAALGWERKRWPRAGRGGKEKPSS